MKGKLLKKPEETMSERKGEQKDRSVLVAKGMGRLARGLSDVTKKKTNR